MFKLRKSNIVKKLVKSSFFIVCSVCFSAFFTGNLQSLIALWKTVLSGVHTHVTVSRVLLLLIVLLLEKSFGLTKNKRFITFLITYNIGLFLSAIMMAIRGCVEVLRLEMPNMID